MRRIINIYLVACHFIWIWPNTYKVKVALHKTSWSKWLSIIGWESHVWKWNDFKRHLMMFYLFFIYLFIYFLFYLFVYFCCCCCFHGVFCLDITLFGSLLQTILSNMTSNVFYFILLHYLVSYMFSIISGEVWCLRQFFLVVHWICK